MNTAAVAPTITTQPANQTVTAGQTATFTVVAAGTAPLSLPVAEERREHRRGDGGELHHAGDRTSDSGSTFRVVVTNTAGTVTSAQRR